MYFFSSGRSIATAASIGLSVLAAVLLIGIATSYSQAIQALMKMQRCSDARTDPDFSSVVLVSAL